MSDLKALYEKATARPWRKAAMGGTSTVLTAAKPTRNDSRIPAYAYREEHCIAYPFIGDRDGIPGSTGDVSLDFVCFSHNDAALIVHAVNSIEASEAEVARLRTLLERVLEHKNTEPCECGQPGCLTLDIRAALSPVGGVE
jgi:hypothetical protein